MTIKQYLLLFLMLISVAARAQSVQGCVTDAETGKPVPLVDVVNGTTGQVTYTDANGNYTLPAKMGDTIRFSSIGYETENRFKNRPVASVMINVSLGHASYQLDDVTFKVRDLKHYRRDSIERAATYKLPLQREHPSSINNPVSAVADMFSKRSKNLYHFQKVFAETETEKFIDTRYTPELVTQVTGLVDDSIGFFMYAHPMTYDYARTATDLEIKMWIRQNYKAWVKK